MIEEAVKDLLYKMADDLLIIGHRNSEWTGFGPLLEEDIAFSSMAQDKIGQSLALYNLLHEIGEQEPDTVAFMRYADQFHNCQFVELPNGEYDFSLIRHFLFDTSQTVRFDMLVDTELEPLGDIAKKFRGEVRYHQMHANAFMKKLGNGTDESIERLQKSLDYAMPYALGIFEPSRNENLLIENGVYAGEEVLKNNWLKKVDEIISKTQLVLPDTTIIEPVFGGRNGIHTEYLQPLLDEMSEVIKSDPTAEW